MSQLVRETLRLNGRREYGHANERTCNSFGDPDRAAELNGTSRTRIFRAIRDKDLPPAKMGSRTTLIEASELARWISPVSNTRARANRRRIGRIATNATRDARAKRNGPPSYSSHGPKGIDREPYTDAESFRQATPTE